MSSSRFTVTKPEQEQPGPPAGDADQSANGTKAPKHYGATGPEDVTVEFSGSRDSGGYVIIPGESIAKESDHLVINAHDAVQEGDKHFALYEDESEERPFVARVLSRMANYEGGMVPNVEQEGLDDDDIQKPKKKSKEKSNRLGTVLGVYFPCIQNIFGVILFIRLTWVVGAAGWLEAFFIVFLCCCCVPLSMRTLMVQLQVAVI